MDIDRMDGMFKDMQLEFNPNIEDEPTLEVKGFLGLLKVKAITQTHKSDLNRFCDPPHGY
jgi:hypothetical protein